MDETRVLQFLIPGSEGSSYPKLSPKERTKLTEKAIRETLVCRMPHCNDGVYRNNDDDRIAVCRYHAIKIWAVIDKTSDRKPLTEIQMNRHLRQARADQERIDELESRRVQPGTVYYLQVGEHVKIGFTADLKQRMKAYPPTSKLLAAHPGTRHLEGEMHRTFGGSRAAGREWFLDTPELRRHIDQVVSQFGAPEGGAA